MTVVLYIALFGALGCLARYFLSGWAYELIGRALPFGTLVVNVLGAFLIGLVMDGAAVGLCQCGHAVGSEQQDQK